MSPVDNRNKRKQSTSVSSSNSALDDGISTVVSSSLLSNSTLLDRYQNIFTLFCNLQSETSPFLIFNRNSTLRTINSQLGKKERNHDFKRED